MKVTCTPVAFRLSKHAAIQQQVATLRLQKQVIMLNYMLVMMLLRKLFNPPHIKIHSIISMHYRSTYRSGRISLALHKSALIVAIRCPIGENAESMTAQIV